MIDPAPIRERFTQLSQHLDERERRLLAAVEARGCGYGGVAAVSRATGIAASTIGRGLKELAGEGSGALGRPGWGQRGRGGPKAAGGHRPRPARQSDGTGRARRTGRSDVAVALDV